jgi:hypothetical protein
MKDQEFIELLNLYLDHEISVGAAARLESEVQRNPARYRVYREYCQMHKACALLSPAHAAGVPAAAAFESRSRTWGNPFALGGLMAAAAAVAFVFLNHGPSAAPASSGGVAVAENPVVAPASSENAALVASPAPRSIGQPVTEALPLGRSDYQPVLATQTLRWNTSEVAAPPVQDARFNWIETLQLASVPQVPADALRFETKTMQKDGQRSFGSGHLGGPTEYNAFQFQR